MSFKNLTNTEALKCQEHLANGTAEVKITPTKNNMLDLYICGILVSTEELYSSHCETITYLADGNIS